MASGKFRKIKIIDKGHVIDYDNSNPIACPLRHDNSGRDFPCTNWCAWFSVSDDSPPIACCQNTIIGQVEK